MLVQKMGMELNGMERSGVEWTGLDWTGRDLFLFIPLIWDGTLTKRESASTEGANSFL